MKKLKLPKLSFRAITSILLILVVLAEIFFTFKYLYSNLQSSSSVDFNTNNITKADLKGYADIYSDLNDRQNFVAKDYDFINSDPFMYGN